MGWRGRQEQASGWGTRVNPWLIHVNVWQKPLQYCKVISLQLIKINGKKKNKFIYSRSSVNSKHKKHKENYTKAFIIIKLINEYSGKGNFKSNQRIDTLPTI